MKKGEEWLEKRDNDQKKKNPNPYPEGFTSTSAQKVMVASIATLQ